MHSSTADSVELSSSNVVGNEREVANVMQMFSRLFGCCYTFSMALTKMWDLGNTNVGSRNISEIVYDDAQRATLVRVLGRGATGVALYASRNARKAADTQRLRLYGNGALAVGQVADIDEASQKFYTVKFVNLSEMHPRDVARVVSEVEALRMCSFFSIIRVMSFLVRHNGPVDLRDNEVGIELAKDAAGLVLELEYVNNGDLRSELATRRKNTVYFPQYNLLMIFAQIAMAIYYLHECKGILHRDIKPSNVLLSGNGLIKVCDLGFSKILDSQEKVNVKQNLSFCGTPVYMAPEIYRKEKYDKKVDIYGLGCLLYEMMRLEAPFRESGAESLAENVKRGLPPVDAPDDSNPYYYDPELSALVSQMTQQKSDARPDTLQVLCTPLLRRATGALLAAVHDDADRAHNGKSSFTPTEHRTVKNDVWAVTREVVRRQINNKALAGEEAEVLHRFDTIVKEAVAAAATSSPNHATEIFSSEVNRQNDRQEWKNRFLQLVVVTNKSDDDSSAPGSREDCSSPTRKGGVNATFELRLSISRERAAQPNHRSSIDMRRAMDCYPLYHLEKTSHALKKADVTMSDRHNDAFGIQLTSGHLHMYMTTSQRLRDQWIYYLLLAIDRTTDA